MEKAYEIYELVAAYAYAHQLEAFLSTVVIMLGVCFLLVGWEQRKHHHLRVEEMNFVPRRRGKAMRRERERYVNSLIADAIVNGIEDLVFHDHISRTEATNRYRKMASLLRNHDLYPSPARLKEKIKARLLNEKAEDKPNIPGPKPGEGSSAKVISITSAKRGFGNIVNRKAI